MFWRSLGVLLSFVRWALVWKVKVKVLTSKLTDKTWRGPQQGVLGEEHAVLLRKHSAVQGVEGEEKWRRGQRGAD